MIVVNLSGGLGNQMFQYAFGKRFALEYQTDLILDINQYDSIKGTKFNLDGVTNREYALNCFDLKPQLYTESHKRLLFPENNLYSKVKFKLERILKRKALVFEQKNGFDDTIYSRICNNTYAYGHWQSPLYFENIKSILVKEFSFNNIGETMWEYDIRQANSISVHIRRGDYVSSPSVNTVHGICSLDYYRQAIQRIEQAINGAKFYIFSDDIDWCKANITWLPNSVFVENNDGPTHQDMYLMSICKHNIIANSTFSWWAAWLNQHKGKIVIGPQQWFRNHKASDLKIFPDEWMAI